METPFKKGEKVYLRPLELSDAPTCQKWINDPEVAHYVLHGRFPMNLIREENWIRENSKKSTAFTFALCLKEEDRHIGVCGFDNISWVDRRGELGIIIGEKDTWDKGYGTETMRLLLDHAFFTLNLNRVQLQVYDFNQRAIHLYEKLGFQIEGTLRQGRYKRGKYRDEIIMAILREEWKEKSKEGE